MTAVSRACALAATVLASSLLLVACGSKIADEAVAELKARHGTHEDPFTTEILRTSLM